MIKTVKHVFLAFAISVVTGLVCGMAGILFHKSIELVTEIREEYPFLIYLLPIAGIIIAAMYTYAKKYGSLNTMRVVSAIKDGKDVPFIMAPLIFVSSCISHLCGASVGREGAALQLGGSIGYKIGTLFKLPKEVKKFMAPVGMSAVFSAVFGTPLTASVFVVEAAGFPNILILLCTLVSSFAAFFTSLLLGVAPVRFNIPGNNEYTLKFILAVVITGIVCGIVSVIFNKTLKIAGIIFKRIFKSPYFMGMAGGVILICMTLVAGTYDYNGAGMKVIESAMMGEVFALAFLIKIIFTSVSVGAGFKGGEIVPTFFVGATLGCTMGKFLGINPSVASALGFTALFCGMVNCPISSLIIAMEVFGFKMIPAFAIAVAVSYICSGKGGLYPGLKK